MSSVNPNDVNVKKVRDFMVLATVLSMVGVCVVVYLTALTFKVQSAIEHGIAPESIGVYIPVLLVTAYTASGIIALLVVILAGPFARKWHQNGSPKEIGDLKRRIRARVCSSGWRVVGYVIVGVPVGAFLWWMFILL